MKISTPCMIFQCMLTGFLLLGCEGKNAGAGEVDKSQQKIEQSDGEAVAQTTAVDPKSGDMHPGKALHDANCISCHDSGAYSRENRKIGDFPKLLAQVKRCDANLGSRFLGEEIKLVADYLNQTYYKYEK